MATIKIISGGQTGIDRMSLEVARDLGLLTGGTAPKGYMTENGPDFSLREFGLVEHIESGYPARTRQNINDADATVLYGDIYTGGTKLTLDLCVALSKLHIENPTPEDLTAFLIEHHIETLNVAGNRGSKLTVTELRTYRENLEAALSAYRKYLAKEAGQERKRGR